jgi:hypothetical protein
MSALLSTGFRSVLQYAPVAAYAVRRFHEHARVMSAHKSTCKATFSTDSRTKTCADRLLKTGVHSNERRERKALSACVLTTVVTGLYGFFCTKEGADTAQNFRATQ